MSLNRRGFLRGLGLLAGGLVLDPERLLWVPGRKTIFAPKALSFSELAAAYYRRMALEQLKRNFVFMELYNGDLLPARRGETVNWYRYSA